MVTYTVTVACPTGNGTPDPAVGAHVYTAGDTATLYEGTPDAGYEFDHIEITISGITIYTEQEISSVVNADWTVDYYYRTALPANKSYLVSYWDSVTSLWKPLYNTHIQEISDERRGIETATFTIPNTAANRTLLNLDDKDAATDTYIKIYYGTTHNAAHVAFYGVVTGGNLTKNVITVYCYNPSLLTMERAPNPITESYTTTAADTIITDIKLNHSGVTLNLSLTYSPAADPKLDTPISIEFKGEDAMEAIRQVCEIADLDLWGVSAAPLITFANGHIFYVGTRTDTVNTPSYFPEESSHSFDRRKTKSTIIIRGKDAGGTPIAGSAGVSGAVKTYIYPNPTDAATLGSLAIVKLALDSNPSIAIPITLLTEEAIFYHPGEYLVANKTELTLSGSYIIQRISKGETTSIAEVDVLIPKEITALKDVSDMTVEQALTWASS